MNLKITKLVLDRLYQRADQRDPINRYPLHSGDLVLLGRDTNGIIRGYTLMNRSLAPENSSHRAGCATMGNYDTTTITKAADELRAHNLIPTAYGHLEDSGLANALKRNLWDFKGTGKSGTDWVYKLKKEHFYRHEDLPIVLIYPGYKPIGFVTVINKREEIVKSISIKVIE